MREVAKLESNLLRIANQAPEKASKARQQTGEDILDLAQQLAPYKTGELRDSGATEEKDESTTIVGFTAPHAPHQEYGTSVMEAQPFLTPAFHQSESTFQFRLLEAMKEE